MTAAARLAMLLLIIPALSSCARFKKSVNRSSKEYTGPLVNSTVTAYSDDNYKNELKKSTVLNFKIPTESEIRFRSDAQEVIKSCRKAAEQLGIKTVVDAKDCTDCIDVLTMHKYEFTVTKGDPQTNCAAYYGTWYGAATCYTYRPTNSSNDRWVGLTFYSSKERKAIHQIDSYSQGYTKSVLKVATEMCYAALEDFPSKFENKEYKISIGLQVERKPASATKR